MCKPLPSGADEGWSGEGQGTRIWDDPAAASFPKSPHPSPLPEGEGVLAAEDDQAAATRKTTGWLVIWRPSAKRRAGRWPSVPATKWRSSWTFPAVSARPWCNRGGRKVSISASTWRMRPSSGVAGRHAINVMLLHACHFLRMARATTRHIDGATVYGWEVCAGSSRPASARRSMPWRRFRWHVAFRHAKLPCFNKTNLLPGDTSCSAAGARRGLIPLFLQ